METAGKHEEIIAQFHLSGHSMGDWLWAHYELGNIFQELGNKQKSREFYGRFLDLWSNGDPDIPILKEAQAEYANLQ